MNPDIQFILNKAYAYCGERKIKLSTLGRLVVNDGKFFTGLEDGKTCRVDTCERVKNWFKNNFPKNNKKPSNIRTQ